MRSKRLLEVLRNICPAIKCGSMMLKPDLTSTAMVPRFCIFNPPKLHFYYNENKTEPTRPCMNIEKCKVKKQSTGENLFTITDDLGTTTHLMPVPAEYMKKWGWKDHVQVAEGRRSNEIARIICSWKTSAYDKVVDPQEVKYMRFKICKENHIGFGLVLRQLPGDDSHGGPHSARPRFVYKNRPHIRIASLYRNDATGEEGPAGRAGIKVNDIVLTINGDGPVSTMQRAAKHLKVATTAVIDICRLPCEENISDPDWSTWGDPVLKEFYNQNIAFCDKPAQQTLATKPSEAALDPVPPTTTSSATTTTHITTAIATTTTATTTTTPTTTTATTNNLDLTALPPNPKEIAVEQHLEPEPSPATTPTALAGSPEVSSDLSQTPSDKSGSEVDEVADHDTSTSKEDLGGSVEEFPGVTQSDADGVGAEPLVRGYSGFCFRSGDDDQNSCNNYPNFSFNEEEADSDDTVEMETEVNPYELSNNNPDAVKGGAESDVSRNCSEFGEALRASTENARKVSTFGRAAMAAVESALVGLNAEHPVAVEAGESRSSPKDQQNMEADDAKKVAERSAQEEAIRHAREQAEADQAAQLAQDEADRQARLAAAKKEEEEEAEAEADFEIKAEAEVEAEAEAEVAPKTRAEVEAATSETEVEDEALKVATKEATAEATPTEASTTKVACATKTRNKRSTVLRKIRRFKTKIQANSESNMSFIMCSCFQLDITAPLHNTCLNCGMPKSSHRKENWRTKCTGKSELKKMLQKESLDQEQKKKTKRRKRVKRKQTLQEAVAAVTQKSR